MSDAMTMSSDFSAAITFKVQKKVLANLRTDLYWANEALAEKGDFDKGTDSLLFTNVPDLSPITTAMTEGVTPDRRKLTMGTVTVDTDQYGDLISISDVAKVKSPLEVVNIGQERLTRASQETLDLISRDAVSGGGTVAYASADHSTRATLDSSDTISVAFLKKVSRRMFKAGIPKHADGFYHLAVAPEVAGDLSEDSDFEEAYKYVDNTPMIQNEIGKIAGFRVQEVQTAPTFSSGVTVYASIATGAIKPWGAGELSSLQTYHVAPGGDHSDPLAQEELLGWKVMFGVAVLSNSYYFRIESAATALS